MEYIFSFDLHDGPWYKREDLLIPVLEAQPERLAPGFTRCQWKCQGRIPDCFSEFPQTGGTSLKKRGGHGHVVRSLLGIVQVLNLCQSTKDDLIGVSDFFGWSTSSFLKLSWAEEGGDRWPGKLASGLPRSSGRWEVGGWRSGSETYVAMRRLFTSFSEAPV